MSETKFETDNWPLIRAKYYTRVFGKRKVRLIVIHSMEAPEGIRTAENVGKYFQNPPIINGKQLKPSAHVGIDGDSTVQYVFDNDVANAAPGANHDGIQVELAGFARQSPVEWVDEYGIRLLERAADVVAQYCLKYDIPVRKLSHEELKGGIEKGIVGHDQVSRAFKRSDHTDPGRHFPWTYFLAEVEKAKKRREEKER